MMDHARHLSSPSPTSSPFFFHHSNSDARPTFTKTNSTTTNSSNSLAPLLSSSPSNVDAIVDRFSSTTSLVSTQPKPQGANVIPDPVVASSTSHNTQTSTETHSINSSPNGGDQSDHQNDQTDLMDDDDNHHLHHHHLQNLHHLHHSQDSITGEEEEDDDDDDDGDDDDIDDVRLHNMLSASSNSSSSTMPLLAESHSHHSFSRISLEDYSPLSLVEDCDHSLPISPTSLVACGSHHSFKSSLNAMKMDNLSSIVGDVDVVGLGSVAGSHQHGGHHHTHGHGHHHHNHHGSQDDVNDAHSMSPSLNLWSNSSTAITQNTSLLNSHTSGSFLLSHHHHQQLNSLIQQLEPQSLDESPLVCGGGSGVSGGMVHSHFDTGLMSSHRPSSEPPPGALNGDDDDDDLLDSIDTKSLNLVPVTTSSLMPAPSTSQASRSSKSKAGKGNVNLPNNVSVVPSRSRRSRSKSGGSLGVATAANNSKSSCNKKALTTSEIRRQLEPPAQSSKDFLQTNHSKKLQELQRRLFGPVEPVDADSQHSATSGPSDPLGGDTSSTKTSESKGETGVKIEPANTDQSAGESGESARVKVEPDSSAPKLEAIFIEDNMQPSTSTAPKPTRSRPTRLRKSRAKGANLTSMGPPKSTPSLSKQLAGGSVAKSASSKPTTVTKETAEPDTTTKISDCTKLADLLSSPSTKTTATPTNRNSDLKEGNLTKCKGGSGEAMSSSSSVSLPPEANNNISNGADETSPATNSDQHHGASNSSDTKQQIQLQVSPSLTVLASAVVAPTVASPGGGGGGNLMQPMNIQQHQQQSQTGQSNASQNNSSGSNTTLTLGQILYRSPAGAASTTAGSGTIGSQLKGLVSNSSAGASLGAANEPLKGQQQHAAGDVIQNNSGQATLVPGGWQPANNSTVGPHQIAIQVICQDGTSLVLPVSSTAGLNAAVSLSAHPQLQAVLTGSANASIGSGAQHLQLQTRGANNANQPTGQLSLVSVSNLTVANQQQQQSLSSSATTATTTTSSSASASSCQPPISGLAASSPTLAALLDAGSHRLNGIVAAANSNGNNLELLAPSSGLSLKRLGSATETRPSQAAASTGALDTSASATKSQVSGGRVTMNFENSNGQKHQPPPSSSPTRGSGASAAKRAKLGGAAAGGNSGTNSRSKSGSGKSNKPAQSTTKCTGLIDAQNSRLIVSNGNRESGKRNASEQLKSASSASKQRVAPIVTPKTTAKTSNSNGQRQAPGNSPTAGGTSATSSAVAGNPQQQQSQSRSQSAICGKTKETSPTTTPANGNSSTSTSTNSSAMSASSKPNKMSSSSTGNRQVDPAQPFCCEHCNSTFTRLGNFTRHKKIHTVPTKDGQRFKCEVCAKSFLQRCDLARHLHIHRGTEPHRCNICGKGYIRHSDLVTHQRFHNKEKPFGCPQCSKGFCQRGDLNRHLRSIHLQMKPILCPCCNRKFAKQETLLRHLNTTHRTKPTTTGIVVSAAGASAATNTNGGVGSDGAAIIVTGTIELNNNGNSGNHSGGPFAAPLSTSPLSGDKQQSNVSNNKSAVLVVNNLGGIGNAEVAANNDTNTIKGQDNRQDVTQKGNTNGTSGSQVASLQAIQATLCKVQQQTVDAEVGTPTASDKSSALTSTTMTTTTTTTTTTATSVDVKPSIV